MDKNLNGEYVDRKISEMVSAIEDVVSDYTVSVTIRFNYEGYEISTKQRTPKSLKKAGISMRNIKGQWIESEVGK